MSLVQKTKTACCCNLDQKKGFDSKSFSKYRKHHFIDKSSSLDKINLVEKYLIINQNKEIAETFNDFFTKAVSHWNISRYEDASVNFEQILDPIVWMIQYYKNHPSILAISSKLMSN